MRTKTWIFILILLFAEAALAHGGGIDKCGGHRDKKQGGYHVHDQAKYCACYPQSENCAAKESRERKPEQKDKSAPPSSKQ
jgi:hypothetical protein